MSEVVICDPPSPLRTVLARRIAEVPGIDSVGVVDDVEALDVLLGQERPDIVLLASQPRGARPGAAVRLVRAHAPRARILLLTMGTDPDDVVAGMAAGAVGYLARDAAVPEAAAALAMIPAQEGPRPAGLGAAATGVDEEAALTDRELEVLQGMSRGRSNSEIGADLFLSEDTIKTHARRLFRKMRVNDRAHAVAEGFRRGHLT